jgi:hypothetical protein
VLSIVIKDIKMFEFEQPTYGLFLLTLVIVLITAICLAAIPALLRLVTGKKLPPMIDQVRVSCICLVISNPYPNSQPKSYPNY